MARRNLLLKTGSTNNVELETDESLGTNLYRLYLNPNEIWDYYLTIATAGPFVGKYDSNGAIDPTTFEGNTIFALSSIQTDDTFMMWQLSGQITDVYTLDVEIQGFGEVTLEWDDDNDWYSVINTGLTAYLLTENGNTIGVNMTAIPATVYDVANVDSFHTVQLLPVFVDFSDEIPWGSTMKILDGTWAGTERTINQSGYYSVFTYVELANPWLPCTGVECDFTQIAIY